ncbi:MAG: DUF3253 domain-containing protein [Pseudomonadota bacterium]
MGKNVIKIERDEKICKTCCLPFGYRKKWQDNWDEVQFCSEKCRKRRGHPAKDKIEAEILRLATERRSSSFCPSEVARNLFQAWRPQMEPVREVARKLAIEGKILITQKGVAVKTLRFRGPIRLKLPS